MNEPIDIDRLTIAAVGVLGLLAVLAGWLGIQNLKTIPGPGAPHGA